MKGIVLAGGWGWGLFGFVWLCAIIGTVVSFRKMEEHSYVETVCYILMGLSVLVVFKQLFALSPTACYWIIAEGVCYITGAAFYSLRKARYMHSVFFKSPICFTLIYPSPNIFSRNFLK